MPPGVKVNRHTHTDDDESEPIVDVDSSDEDDEHSHTEDEESDEDDEDDYSGDDNVHEDELEVATGGPWEFLDAESSIIDPSDSASRSRHPTALPRSSSQRQYHPPPRPTGRRVKSSRDYAAVPEPPPGPIPRRGSKRPTRSRSVLEGPMEDEEYPYGYGRHHGALPHHPPPRDWDPYGGSRSVLSSYDDPYAEPNPNPFMMPADQYQAGRRGNRTSMPPRAASSGHELMALGHYGAQYNPYGAPPGGYPYGPPGYHGYYPPPHHSQGPSPSPGHSKKGTPAPEEAKAKTPDPSFKIIEAMLLDQKKREQDRIDSENKKILEMRAAEASSKLKAEEDKLAELQKLIMRHNAEQLEREKKMEAARQSELAAKAAAEARAAEEKKRADEKDKEIKHAAEKAKMEAEKEAQKKADEEKLKHEKEIEEVKKKAAEFEAQKKKFEEEAKALRPKDDMLKPPIKFKDAVGRKFNFPWHVCKTWKGMESLILQAFSHIDNLGQMVQDGHYDLIGPDNEIILPQIWETMVQPDMAIHMQMWPVPEKKQKAPPPPPHPHAGFMHHGGNLADLLHIQQPRKSKEERKKEKERDKKIKAHMQQQMPMGMVPPPPPPLGVLLGGMTMPPPPPPGGLPPGIMEIPAPGKKIRTKDGKKNSKTSSSSKGGGGLLGWMAGAPVKKESSKKKK